MPVRLLAILSRFFRVLRNVFVALVALSLMVLAWIEIDLQITIHGAIYNSVQAIPHNDTAMVLGAEVTPDKTPSDALAKRLDAAIALYKTGKVQHLLMSGDNRVSNYNEVAVMQAYALEAGVPERDVQVDEAGLHTFDSCYRARFKFGLSQLTVVSQGTHLPRALYTCRKIGIDAVGMAAPGLTNFSFKLREQAALVLAWYELNIAN